MEQESRGRRQVDIFNFSFLDILACVIGLLIFILTIVVISGGGSSSPKRAQRVAEAEHDLADARASAGLANARRVRAEALLVQRADQVIDPVAAAGNVQRQIDSFARESQELRDAAARLGQRIRQVGTAVDVEKGMASAADGRVTAAEAQTHDFEQRIAAAEAQAAKVRGTKKPQKDVPFYVARVHETDRTPVLVELTGDRFFFLDSDDYERDLLNARDTALSRKDSAQGTLVSELVDGKGATPEPLAARPAAQIVISIALRPDAFASFRQLRDWAWSKGYAVYWLPISQSEKIVVTRGVPTLEQ